MNIIKFDNSSELEAALSLEIVKKLNRAINERGSASILFSGGSTPKALMNRLATLVLDWSKLHIGLVDDRMVETSSEFSNMAMLKRELIDRIASDTKPIIYPLVLYSDKPEENLIAALSSMQKLGELDVVILGMGTDGHFASLFPEDEASQMGLEEECPEILLYTRAATAPQHRISCTWPYLRSADSIFLHITGTAKLELLQSDVAASLPVSRLLHCKKIETYWTF